MNEPGTTRSRRLDLDYARGVAVLLMIEAHTTDAWTHAAAKQTVWFSDAAILGGFAAPLFLWLAGVAAVLSATRAASRERGRAAAAQAVCRRGLEIFILAFLFRIQAFALTPGGHPLAIFRVDILNIMGPAIVATGVVWGALRDLPWLVGTYATLAIAAAMLAPIVRDAPVVDLLPTWVQWYVRPAGDYTTFTAFPWAGFVFAGAAWGALIARFDGGDPERRLQRTLGTCGVAVIATGWYLSTRPSIYHASSFWTTSPTWFVMRAGILMLLLAGLYLLAGARHGLTCAPLARFGRSSLFLYWIHVELVYGYATWPLRGRLPLWGTMLAASLFAGLMYLAIIGRDRTRDAWRRRRRTERVETALAQASS
jgi:uncharacterized membrane protein